MLLLSSLEKEPNCESWNLTGDSILELSRSEDRVKFCKLQVTVNLCQLMSEQYSVALTQLPSIYPIETLYLGVYLFQMELHGDKHVVIYH